MRLPPIFSSLAHNKVGASLIALQIAVTLAVLCNAFFIIETRTAQTRAPSGVRDESDVFVIQNFWLGQSQDLPAREKTDLAALRSLPQVSDATVSLDHPLGGGLMGEGVTLHPDEPRSGTTSAIFLVDDHGLSTYGLKLIAGRDFRSDEIVDRRGLPNLPGSLAGVIITQALAKKLSADGNLLGHTVTLIPDNTPAPIIGIVDRLQSTPRAGNSPFAQMSLLAPYLWADAHVFYIVRAKPGQATPAMSAARNKLYEISHQRVVNGMQTLAEARRDSYRGDRALALLMSVISGILLGVTAFGIVGLTSYWVTQRRRQIGIRRALGATRGTIVRHFQVENLIIAATGAALGVALAVMANLWLLQSVSLARLPLFYPIIGVIIMLALSQLAVLWPALRAASVPPAVATRMI